MALIPQDFIDTLIERTDIVSLVSSRVQLKKAGREYTARCPFHDEKTPSFYVSPTKQFYHCFGCGAHGTAISFLMEYDRLEFLDAIDVLAQFNGLEVPRETSAAPTSPSKKSKDNLYEIMAQAAASYQNALRQAPEAISYLKNRGVSGQIAKTFGLGYAPQAWNFLKLPDQNAGEKAGLLIHRDDGGYHDRFRNRIMFPIRDTRGRTIAFGGRTLGDDKAKYLNSPETPLFHKSRHVYGLYEARRASRSLPFLLVTEGYMDVIALAEFGITHVVATLGTATTTEHLSLLFRHTDTIIFCFDGDAAGRRAADKAMLESLPAMRGAKQVKFLFLPDGEDPDTLVRSESGRAFFQQAQAHAKALSAMVLDYITQGLETDSPEARTQLKANAQPIISALPPDTFRSELAKELSRLTGDPAQDIITELSKKPAFTPQQPQISDTRAIRITVVSKALQLLLHRPALAHYVNTQDLAVSHAKGVKFLIEAIEFFKNDASISIARWLERYRQDRAFDRLQKLASSAPPGDDPEQHKQDFLDCIHKLVFDAQQQNLLTRYQQLLAQQSQRDLTAQETAAFKNIIEQLKNKP